MVRDEENNFLCTIDEPKKRKLNVKKVLILLVLFLIIVALMMITKNSMDIIHARKLQEQQEAEQIALQKQKEAENFMYVKMAQINVNIFHGISQK